MPQDPETPARDDLAFLAFAVLAWLVATAHFLWLGAGFMPTQAALLTRIDVELPLYLRLVHVTPHRLIRSLPFAFLAGPLVGLLLLWVSVRLRGLRWRSARVVRTLAVLALAATSATVLASFAVVQVTMAVYERLVMEPRFQGR
jgi:hypothetical protein